MTAGKLQQQIEDQILTSYESLYRLAYTYVKNPDDAMDIVQETAYKAIVNSAGVREEAAVKSWLYRILVNTALDFLRRRSKEAPAETLPDPGREDAYRDWDTLRALDSLTPRERTVVVLRFFEDRELRDIADITGENINTVKTILYRSLKKLKIRLTEGESA